MRSDTTTGQGAAPAAAERELLDELPAAVLRVPGLGWLAALSGEGRGVALLSALAAILALPYLGATGFWDPWEPHYGEVAREMIARGDYLNPWWESSWFFSKPALDLWAMAAGMLVAGSDSEGRAVGVYTEWCVRLPFAATAALGAVLLFVAAGRLLGRRPAFLGALALLTSPLFVLLSRQAVPDPLFVGLLTASMACLAIVLFDHEPSRDRGSDPSPGEDDSPSRREGWLLAFYVFVGLGVLAKGLLSFALPGAVVLAYCVLTGEWHRLRRLRLAMGTVVVLAVCGPWFAHMFAFDGRDDEGKTFFERFIVHDHFKRLAVGVHTTTPGGSFTYYVEQLGFDLFPWVFAIPGAAAELAKVRMWPGGRGDGESATRAERMALFLLLWLLIGFALFAFGVTKFHHYCFPVLPPLLLFCALWIEALLRGGLRPQAGAILAGGVLYGLVAKDLGMHPKHLTDLFVYNYDRAYPEREVDPRPLFQLLFFAAPAVALSPWVFDRAEQLWRGLRALLPRRGRAPPDDARAASAPVVEAPQDRLVVVASLAGLALVFAGYLGWTHWRRLTPHWSQRDLLWIYQQQAQPDEPLAAYQMNWRGETFYSKNRVRQVARGAAPNASLQDFLTGPGPRKWVLVEQGRLGALRQAVGTAGRLKVVEGRNVKFALAVIEPGAPPIPPPAASPSPAASGAAAPIKPAAGSAGGGRTQESSGGVPSAPAASPAPPTGGAPP